MLCSSCTWICPYLGRSLSWGPRGTLVYYIILCVHFNKEEEKKKKKKEKFESIFSLLGPTFSKVNPNSSLNKLEITARSLAGMERCESPNN